VRKIVLLLGCFAASPLAAGEATLNADALKTTLGGSRLALDTPLGSTVSVKINHDGLMSGEAGTALGTVLGAATDRGRWWVSENKVCFKWFRWFDAEARCVTISVEGKRFTWRRDDGDTGTGTIVEAGNVPAKPATVVARAQKRVAPVTAKPDAKPVSKTVDLASAAELKPAPHAVAEKPAPQPPVINKEALLPAKLAEAKLAEARPAEAKPAPRPAAARSLQVAKIAVANVKPQFFAAQKSGHAKTVAPVAVASAHVTKTPAAPARVAKATPAKADTTPFRVAGVEATDVLNIRRGPSSDNALVGGIPSDGHGITITGPCQNEWCPVKHQSLSGWVNRRFLVAETTTPNRDVAAFTGAEYFAP
jgi:uncharacterized protein YraI